MGVRAMLADLDEAVLAELMHAAAQGCLVRKDGDDLYAVFYSGPEWWVWRLRPGSEEHAVCCGCCTCPAPKPCKHLRMVGANGDTRPWRVPLVRRSHSRPGRV